METAVNSQYNVHLSNALDMEDHDDDHDDD